MGFKECECGVYTQTPPCSTCRREAEKLNARRSAATTTNSEESKMPSYDDLWDTYQKAVA